jgi:DNA repair protein RecO (recombination protein O)
LESICYAGYFAELVDDLTEIYDPHEKIFDLLDLMFRYLPSLPGPRLSRFFEIKLLNEIGWLPFLASCVQCGEKKIEQGFFSARQGALLCVRCASRCSDAKALSPESLAVMRYYISHGLEDSIRRGMTRQTETELGNFMKDFFDERLHRPLDSLRFLAQLKPVLSAD